MIEVIKSQEQYERTMRRVDELLEASPAVGSANARELEVLAVLVQEYERKEIPLLPPSPLAAIRMRMDQMDIAPKDLVPFIGSRGRVSEILTGKRALTLPMIRALHAKLQIPLESLISDEVEDSQSMVEADWDRFPVREMARRGWIQVARSSSRARIRLDAARDALRDLFGPNDKLSLYFSALQKTDRVRTAPTSDRFALTAWSAYVHRRAERSDVRRTFRRSEWTPELLRELRGLSRYDVGPRLATQFLEERGIIVDIVPHLPRTRLDGAAMLRGDGVPIIALTVRHDRVDNFWFTLFHELMHVLLHLTAESTAVRDSAFFVDDLDLITSLAPIEREADDAAREALVPNELWERSAARYAVAALTVKELAREAGVGDAVVAGRVRFEHKNWRLLSNLVGAGTVRGLFPEVDWAGVK